jgi:hypothetical protein
MPHERHQKPNIAMEMPQFLNNINLINHSNVFSFVHNHLLKNENTNRGILTVPCRTSTKLAMLFVAERQGIAFISYDNSMVSSDTC